MFRLRRLRLPPRLARAPGRGSIGSFSRESGGLVFAHHCQNFSPVGHMSKNPFHFTFPGRRARARLIALPRFNAFFQRTGSRANSSRSSASVKNKRHFGSFISIYLGPALYGARSSKEITPPTRPFPCFFGKEIRKIFSRTWTNFGARRTRKLLISLKGPAPVKACSVLWGPGILLMCRRNFFEGRQGCKQYLPGILPVCRRNSSTQVLQPSRNYFVTAVGSTAGI